MSLFASETSYSPPDILGDGDSRPQFLHTQSQSTSFPYSMDSGAHTSWANVLQHTPSPGAFKTGSYYMAQAGLELSILLPQAPEC